MNWLEAKTRVIESSLPGQYNGILCSIDSNDKDWAYWTKSTSSIITVTIDIPIIIAGSKWFTIVIGLLSILIESMLFSIPEACALLFLLSSQFLSV